MAEHLWFIPVTGGGPYLPHVPGSGPILRPEQFNVQWDSNFYPTNQATDPEHPFLEVEAVTQFDSGTTGTPNVPGELRNCYGQWRWDSCPDGDDMHLGGQLNVGTVFANELPHPSGDILFNTVDIWVKLRVDTPARLDSLFLVIGEAGGLAVPTVDLKGSITGGATWDVFHHSKTGSWDGWDRANLRSTVSFLGTTNTANAGRVKVDVEWFAFRLTT